MKFQIEKRRDKKYAQEFGTIIWNSLSLTVATKKIRQDLLGFN